MSAKVESRLQHYGNYRNIYLPAVRTIFLRQEIEENEQVEGCPDYELNGRENTVQHIVVVGQLYIAHSSHEIYGNQSRKLQTFVGN